MSPTPHDRRCLAVLHALVAHHGAQHWWAHQNRLYDWVATILIQQTTQANAEKALANLGEDIRAEWLHTVPLDELERRIRPAGFYKQKAQYLKNLMAWFARYDFDLRACDGIADEALRRELLAIKGVGAETADAMLLYIFNRKTFIADQYALRLFRRLQLGDYSNYAAMRRACQHLTQYADVQECKEWHACIDVHGKAYRLQKDFDESFLQTAIEGQGG